MTLCEVKKRRNTFCLSSIFDKTKLKKDHFITVDKFQYRSNERKKLFKDINSVSFPKFINNLNLTKTKSMVRSKNLVTFVAT
ncbi:MAG: hypothetical protein FWC41_01790, partial [Firmicutes bacterium]|nr:hypothetical protein [Bacillota bacterium]